MSDPLQAIHRALLHIRDEGPSNPRLGLCANVRQRIESSELIRWDCLVLSTVLWKDWPHYSGEPLYPLPGGLHTYFDNAHSKWRRHTEYGRLRWDLLDHVIGVIEAKLSEEPQ